MAGGELQRDVWPWLSPNDKAWTWQDGEWHTALRQLLRDLTPQTLEDLKQEAASRQKNKRHAAAKAYDEMSNELLHVLATLRVITSLKSNFKNLVDQLFLEARERGASWEDLGWAIERNRQTARAIGQNIYEGSGRLSSVLSWLNYDVEAARRVAYEVAQDASETDERRIAVANEFLELANSPEHQEKRRQFGRTPPRRHV